jgi:hypothetical protein
VNVWHHMSWMKDTDFESPQMVYPGTRVHTFVYPKHDCKIIL